LSGSTKRGIMPHRRRRKLEKKWGPSLEENRSTGLKRENSVDREGTITGFGNMPEKRGN